MSFFPISSSPPQTGNPWFDDDGFDPCSFSSPESSPLKNHGATFDSSPSKKRDRAHPSSSDASFSSEASPGSSPSKKQRLLTGTTPSFFLKAEEQLDRFISEKKQSPVKRIFVPQDEVAVEEKELFLARDEAEVEVESLFPAEINDDPMELDTSAHKSVDELIKDAKESQYPAENHILLYAAALENRVPDAGEKGLPNVVKQGLPETKKLTRDQRLRIAAVAEQYFLQHPDLPATYLPVSHEDLPRALLIDSRKREFLVLSGKHGDLYFEGGERIVSKATSFCLDGNVVKRNVYAILKNLGVKDALPLKRQAALAQAIYQDVHLVVEHGRNVFVVEELYEKNTEQAKKTFKPTDIVTLLRQVTNTLLCLRKLGLFHGDINNANVLMKDKSDFKLTDFGMSFSVSDTDWPKRWDEGYGTSRYSAPEHFGVSNVLEDPKAQAAADDMFGVGCMLYSFLFPTLREVPWGILVGNAIEHGRGKDKASTEYKNGYKQLVELTKIEAEAKRKALMEICLQLLEQDPRKRMNLDSLIASV